MLCLPRYPEKKTVAVDGFPHASACVERWDRQRKRVRVDPRCWRRERAQTQEDRKSLARIFLPVAKKNEAKNCHANPMFFFHKFSLVLLLPFTRLCLLPFFLCLVLLLLSSLMCLVGGKTGMFSRPQTAPERPHQACQSYALQSKRRRRRRKRSTLTGR